jgi:hypothetical protein
MQLFSTVTTPSDVLHFKKLKGFNLHKRKTPDSVSSRRHTKIHSDTQGKLRLARKVFQVKKKSNHCRQPSPVNTGFCHNVDIPDCVDNLPPEVDLSIMDLRPRQANPSVGDADSIPETC